MKQNERWLVYAVTGFLALILVIAVLFHDDKAGSGAEAAKPKALTEMFGDGKPIDDVGKAGADKNTAGKNTTGLPSPGEIRTEQPLVAAPKPMLATDLVAQQLGPSRRDRTVRFVRAKDGDSLDSLVRRWCGSREDALAETKALNEELVVLRVGQEVAVPWVEDDELLAAIEAKKPKTLVAQDAALTGSQPEVAMLEAGPAKSGESASANRPKPVSAGGTTYTVKDGDALWKIADRTYGRKNADRMVRAIQDANPGLGDRLRVGQRIVLPKAD